ncbi:DNA primase, partial [Myxococcota bacterium]|nr:DNA primase [Myxococcota bacterium]
MSIPAEKIAEVRDRADIERIVGRSVRLTKRGNRLVGLCPFHSEKTPSFGVDPQKKLYHCFGCQAGGDVFDFVMRLEGLSFVEVIKQIAHEVGVVIEDREESPRERAEREKREKLYELNDTVATFYEHQLEREPTALAYLRDERGLKDETIAQFRLGWAPAEWQALTDHLERKRIDPQLGQQVGLLGAKQTEGRSDKRYYDRLRGRVVFPITLPAGHIAGFGARRADWIEKDAPKYLNSPESPIYDKSSILYGLREAKDDIRRSRRAVLVEGYLDVIGLHQAGVRLAVAACGTALTPRHVSLLKRLTGEVVTMYDGDAAGQDASRKAAELLLSEGFAVRIAQLPDGEDPDTFARKVGEEGVRALMDRAPSAIDFFVARAKSAYGGGGIAGMAKAVDAVKPLLLAVKDPLERDVCLDAAARELGLEPAMLRRHLAAPRGAMMDRGPSQRPDPRSDGRPGAPRPDASRPEGPRA